MTIMSDVLRESVAAYGAALRPMTVTEYYHAAETGVFDWNEKLELIWGEVVLLSPQGGAHAGASANLRDLLADVFPGAGVRTHSPLTLDELNEPEPDVFVAAGPASRYLTRHPRASEILLVVEVADSTLAKDRNLKSTLYAQFGIPEYWILDLRSRHFEVFREPVTEPEGKSFYGYQKVISTSDTVSPLMAAGATIRVDKIIP
jgi:Uma2 family endonuclease